MTSAGICARLGAGICGAVAARRIISCCGGGGVSGTAVSGSSAGGGRSFFRTALAEEASGTTVAWARLISGGGVNGAGAVSTTGSGVVTAGEDAAGASVFAASNAGSGFMGMLASCSASQSGAPTRASAASMMLTASTAFRMKPNPSIAESPSRRPLFPRKQGWARQLLQRLNGNFSLLRFKKPRVEQHKFVR